MNDKRGELFAGKLASTVWGEEYPPFYGNSGGGRRPNLMSIRTITVPMNSHQLLTVI